PVVGENGHRVTVALGVHFGEGKLDRTNARWLLGPLQGEFEDVALAKALELLELFAVASDQPAVHTEVADRALESALCGLQVFLRALDVGLGTAQFAGDLPNLGFALLPDLSDLRRESFVAGLPLLSYSLRQATGAGQLGLRQAEFLRGHIELAFHISQAAVRLIHQGREQFGLIIRFAQASFEHGPCGIAFVKQIAHEHEKNDKSTDDPPGHCRQLVGFSYARASVHGSSLSLRSTSTILAYCRRLVHLPVRAWCRWH